MNLYLIRHGETAKNRQKLLQGRSDVPLNENGRKQARQAARFFEEKGIRFDRVYASPLSSLERPAPELIRFFSDFVHNPAPQGMESLDHVKERMGLFLEMLKETAPSGGDRQGNILASTHAIALKGALEELMPESRGSWWSRYIGTCSVFRTEYAGGIFSSPVEILSLTNEPGV